jgi:thiamine-phosphate diphosphorylase
MDLPRPCLCLVTDRRAAAPGARTRPAELRALRTQLDHAIDAGIDLIQIRERDLEAAALVSFVRDLTRDAPATTRIVVNDRADVAVASGAAGAHLRSDGPSATRLREWAPAGWLIGRSVHAAEEAAAAQDADYLIFGTVFPSGSKPAGAKVAGLEGLRAACGASAQPVLAIGGVTPERVARCRRAGAAGVAAIGAFIGDPRGAIAAMRAQWSAAAVE